MTAFTRTPQMLLIDSVILATVATLDLISSGFVGGSYQNDHIVLPSGNRIMAPAVIDNPPRRPAFTTLNTYKLDAVVPAGDGVSYVLPDFTGHLWFATEGGVAGVLQPHTATLRFNGETDQQLDGDRCKRRHVSRLRSRLVSL